MARGRFPELRRLARKDRRMKNLSASVNARQVVEKLPSVNGNPAKSEGLSGAYHFDVPYRGADGSGWAATPTLLYENPAIIV